MQDRQRVLEAYPGAHHDQVHPSYPGICIQVADPTLDHVVILEVWQDTRQEVGTDPVVSIEKHDHSRVVLMQDHLRDRFIERFCLRTAIDKDDPAAMTGGDCRRFVSTAISDNDDLRKVSSLTVSDDPVNDALLIMCGDHSDGVRDLPGTWMIGTA